MPIFLPWTNFKCILSIATLAIANLPSRPILAQASSSIPIAHAHNDYEHERPLHDALQAGFTSVEADVYLVDNELLVAHDRRDTSPGRSLESLYLNPLRQHFSKRADHSPHKTFWLMIDVKSDATATHRKIQSVLKMYPDLVAKIQNSRTQQVNSQATPDSQAPPVRVVISGNRAKEDILQSQPRLSGIDGRLSDLQSALSSEAMPWISDNWRSHFRWRGQNEFPQEERKKLRRYVKQVHEDGRLLRFWATPDSPALWDELLDAKVDLINADDLRGLQSHLQKRAQQQN